ncbi:MAG: hypothetical protein ACOCRO_04775 [Halanaerobiales bacterium]
MKIEDCRSGMEVRYKKRKSCSFDKGEILKIKECHEPNEVVFEDGRYTHPDYIEPVNKFEIGNEFLWYTDCDLKVSLRGYTKNGRAIVEDNAGSVFKTDFSKLRPLKKKDELIKGDKFTRTVQPEEPLKVLLVDEDYYGKVYVSKTLDGECLVFVRPDEIEEIIYD